MCLIYFTQETAISSVSTKTTLTEFLLYVRSTILQVHFCMQMYHSIIPGGIRHGVDESRELMYLVFLMLNRPMSLEECTQSTHDKGSVSTSDYF